MSLFYSPTLAKIIKKLPGKKFGNYRFLPVFFLFGAALEFTMINLRVGQTNFCMFQILLKQLNLI